MKGGLLFSLLVQKFSLDIEDFFLCSCFILDRLKTISVSNSFTNKTDSMPVDCLSEIPVGNTSKKLFYGFSICMAFA